MGDLYTIFLHRHPTQATVEVAGSETRGMMLVERRLEGRECGYRRQNVTVVEGLDVEAFKRILIDALGK